MAADLVFTGERFLPGTAGEIAYEHWHRYAFARAYISGKRVADVACGEGYGSALLAGAAASVVGVDIAPDAIAHARIHYGGLANVRFEEGSATALPLPDASLDAVVSFETIEHLPREDQSRMLAEFARVLTPTGILVLSTPNPIEYSIARQYRNPFHCHEPERAELAELLGTAFPVHRWFRQRRYFGSAVWSETREERFEAWIGDSGPIDVAQPPAAMYFIVVAARSADALPSAGVGLSLFADRADAELARLDEQAREVIRLDGLLGQTNSTIEKLAARVQYLEEAVVHRDAQLTEIRVERDALLAQLRALMAERNALALQLGSASAALDTAREELAVQIAWRRKLEEQIAVLDRTVAYRQSVRWWLRLPWFRAKLLWQGIRSR
jgi:ubiquinone/menaquinone biosynthesis C-methylase UbiE